MFWDYRNETLESLAIKHFTEVDNFCREAWFWYKMESKLFRQFFPLCPTVLMIDLLNFIMTLIHKESQLTDLKDSVLFRHTKRQGLLSLNTTSDANCFAHIVYIFYWGFSVTRGGAVVVLRAVNLLAYALYYWAAKEYIADVIMNE